MVWYGMVWYGMAWHGVVGMAWYNNLQIIYIHQVEGYLGYAHWVCHTLLSIPHGQTSCFLKGQPHADLSHLPHKRRSIVLIASLALTKYTGSFYFIFKYEISG
jgi:hypothetical protein